MNKFKFFILIVLESVQYKCLMSVCVYLIVCIYIFRAALGRVCLKLVVVMGVTWCADVISWAVGGPHYIWYLTDLINALQGVFIFVVVGCQPQVLSVYLSRILFNLNLKTISFRIVLFNTQI